MSMKRVRYVLKAILAMSTEHGNEWNCEFYLFCVCLADLGGRMFGPAGRGGRLVLLAFLLAFALI